MASQTLGKAFDLSTSNRTRFEYSIASSEAGPSSDRSAGGKADWLTPPKPSRHDRDANFEDSSESDDDDHQGDITIREENSSGEVFSAKVSPTWGRPFYRVRGARLICLFDCCHHRKARIN